MITEIAIASKEQLDLLPNSFAHKLVAGGFLVPIKTNELDVIRRKNDERINQKDYMLTILPTLNCFAAERVLRTKTSITAS